jgi:hypothetical protein
MSEFDKYFKPLGTETKEEESEFDKYFSSPSKTISVEPTQEDATPEGVRDLTDDAIFAKIAPYMASARFGMTEDKFDRQEIVDAYVNHMRKFNFGQSVVTLGELAYLRNASDQDKANAAAAYKTFDSMKGAFAEGTSGMEKLDAVYDYGRALLVDPINLVSLGVGKLVSGGSTKAAAQIAKEAVKREVADIIKKRGLTEGAKQSAKQMERKIIGEVLKNKTFEEITEGALSKRMRSVVTREALGAGLSDTVAGVSMDAAYQAAMQEVGLQTDYDLVQGAVAGASGLFGAGLATGIARFSSAGSSEIDMLSAFYFDKANTELAKARQLAGDVKRAAAKDLNKQGVKDSLKEFKKGIETFAEKVEQGRLVRLMTGGQSASKETQIRKAFYLGDEKTGIKGISGILAENGIRSWTPRFDGDNFTNWLHDLVKEMPDDIQADLDDVFRNTLGKAVSDYKGLSFSQALKQDAEVFSKAGQELNIMSQVSRGLKFIPREEPDKMLEGLVEKEAGRIGENVRKAIGETTGGLQRNLIRMLVTHPGTTALNLIGWQTASSMQSMSDILRGTIYGGNAVLQSLMFNKESASKYANKARLMYGLQKRKAMNLLDPHMTYEAFLDFAAYNPEAQKKMFKYMSGGIEMEELSKELGFQDFAQMAKDMNIKDADSLVQNRGVFEKVMDGFQTVYGVKAQDMLTKSQEFMYALDKRIRVEYGVTYSEFLQDDNLWKQMTGDKYARIVSEASDDALRNVFSKSYGGTEGLLQYTAKAVEDARKYVGIGAMIPFGQFFNNTLGHMFDHTGISLVHKYLSGSTRDPMELLTKSAVGLTLIGVTAAQEMDHLEEGLAWYQERSSDGTIRNRLYDFPYSFYKAVGRMAAHVYRDGEIPKDLTVDIVRTFGPEQLTRQLGDSVKASYDLLLEVAQGEDVETLDALKKIVQNTASMYVSGFTRPLDPVNTISSMAKGKPYVSPDRKQGEEWVNNSLRYVDDILESMELYTKPEQKQRPLTGEQDRLPINRIFGVREELAQTSIQRMFNEAGLPQWQTGIRSSIPKPLNEVNGMIRSMLESHADRLVDSIHWKKADAKQRKDMITAIVRQSKKDLKEIIGNSYNPDDERTSMLFKLGEGSLVSKRDLREYLSDMELGDDPTELTNAQLAMLIEFIELDKKLTKQATQSLVD